jgi:SET domain
MMFLPFPFISTLLLSITPQAQNKNDVRKSASFDEMLRSNDLEIASFPDTGRGLKTTRDRNEKDLLLAIPEDVLITSASILAQYPSLNDALCHKSLSDQQVLTLGLCYKRHEADDYGYVSSLPDQYSVFNMPQDLMTALPRTYQRLVESTRTYALEMYESLADALHSGRSNREIPSLDTFLWAFSMVRSRAFGVGQHVDDRIRPGKGGQYGALVPGLDLINHRVGTQSTLELKNRHWELGSASRSYSAGDQVFISYGSHGDQWNFWLTYGFAGQGPPTVAYFDMVDVLNACALAQPTHFSPAVVQRLKEMVAQVQGVSRNMLGYDEHVPARA